MAANRYENAEKVKELLDEKQLGQLQKRIFEKGVSSKGENRGLGLYLIRQLVDRYRGTIDLVTEAGAGTCFTLTFTRPASEEEQP